jgi:hypothetical protein
MNIESAGDEQRGREEEAYSAYPSIPRMSKFLM